MSGKTYRASFEGNAVVNSNWDVRSVENFTSECLALTEVIADSSYHTHAYTQLLASILNNNP